MNFHYFILWTDTNRKLSKVHLHICYIIPLLFRLYCFCLLVFTTGFCLLTHPQKMQQAFLTVKGNCIKTMCVWFRTLCENKLWMHLSTAAYGVLWKEKSTQINNYSNTSESLWKEWAPIQGNQTTHNLMRFKLLPRVKLKGNHIALAHFTARMNNRLFPSCMMGV